MTEEETFRMDFPDAPFKVIKKIGQGTFSSVFKAVDLNHSDVYNSINYRRTNLGVDFITKMDVV